MDYARFVLSLARQVLIFYTYVRRRRLRLHDAGPETCHGDRQADLRRRPTDQAVSPGRSFRCVNPEPEVDQSAYAWQLGGVGVMPDVVAVPDQALAVERGRRVTFAKRTRAEQFRRTVQGRDRNRIQIEEFNMLERSSLGAFNCNFSQMNHCIEFSERFENGRLTARCGGGRQEIAKAISLWSDESESLALASAGRCGGAERCSAKPHLNSLARLRASRFSGAERCSTNSRLRPRVRAVRGIDTAAARNESKKEPCQACA